jgi:hypothetical protein
MLNRCSSWAILVVRVRPGLQFDEYVSTGIFAILAYEIPYIKLVLYFCLCICILFSIFIHSNGILNVRIKANFLF